MARPRAPWWMYLFAASFLAFFIVTTYNDLWGPEPAGIEASYHDGAMVVVEIRPGSAAEQAGLVAGDYILALDGQPIHSFADWLMIRMNLEVVGSHRLQIERHHDRLQLTLALRQQHPFRRWAAGEQTSFLSFRGAQLLMLLLALVMAFSRPGDMVSRLGALLLANFSVVSGLTGLAALWRQLPAPIGALLWIADLSVIIGPAVFFTFCALFPRKLFHSGWMWIAAWTPIVLSLPQLLIFSYHLVYRPERLTNIIPFWLFSVYALIRLAYYVAGGTALIVNYRRLEDLNQRRRVRVLVVGSLIGLLPFLLSAVISTYFPYLRTAIGRSLANLIAYLGAAFLPVFPLSFAYAILRHQLFDIRIMVRQGLQYALARGVVISMLPAAVALFLLDVGTNRGDIGVVAIGDFFAQSQRGWLYVVIGALALVAQRQRQAWLDTLDRRFYRERYNAQQLLRETAEEIRAAVSLEAIAPRVVARMEAALHPEFAALMVREARATFYRSLAIAPASAAVRDLGTDSKLMAVFRALDKPLAVSLSESSWLKQQLPHEETEFLRSARIELLVPVSLSAEGREALLALGAKRSEEPYSSEDLGLLTAIAAGLALLLERPTSQVAARGFEECPKCGVCYASGVERCPIEGAKLTFTPMPRLLGSRYQLEKRLGQGGMGTVYEASDTALDRRVALKLIREDLVGSAEAAERFRREAKAAASFTHPNVVTVHDFGVASGTRAFLVMELLAGSNLRDELRQRSRLPMPRVVRIVHGVCAALEAAHRRTLIHRDLKPENIFLVGHDTAEMAKVLDFGVAKVLPTDADRTQDAGTAGGILVGTPRYMSPEQLRGDLPAAAWDLWALGLVTYEMLAGQHPFDAPSPGEMHRAILAGRFAPPSTILRECPPGVDEFFASALSLEPERRPASAAAFAATFAGRIG